MYDELVGKTIAAVTTRQMRARDMTYGETISLTEVTFHFTGGSTHALLLDDTDYDASTLRAVPETTVTVRIHNAYEDGHESTHEAEVESPPDDDEDALETWWEEAVWAETGDGTGANLNACYTVTVIRSDNPEHLKLEREWC